METKFNSKEYLEKMLSDKKKHIQIIALLGIKKNYSFDNMEQIQFFITRNSKIAKELSCFELKKIEAVLEYLIETADYKVGLESVAKHILEDVQELKKEEPIMIYNNEKIYDVKRIVELEQDGKIYYDGKNWRKRN